VLVHVVVTDAVVDIFFHVGLQLIFVSSWAIVSY
jgi:hypothetical protein